MPPSSPQLSTILPPLVLGTATFNSQYNPDPNLLPTTEIVQRALSHGVRAFDTSPYYGPAEELLGKALATDFVRQNFPRHDYYLLTKVGRISGSEFDYSTSWVRRSVHHSLERLRTDYLDVVYCHDVEFVSADEVLTAVTELRRIRGESGIVKYVGISGYPVELIADRAQMILDKTGEPLDIVMSYANFTLQNTRLNTVGLPRLRKAGVDVVPNASVLGMGLLRRKGVPIGAQGDFHPSPPGLREAIKEASKWCDGIGDKIEKIAIRYAMESWMREGERVGSRGDPASGVPWKRKSIGETRGRKLGVSVMGVSNIEELDETLRVWRSILDGLEDGEDTAIKSGRGISDRDWSLRRQKEVIQRTVSIRQILKDWIDYSWPSPPPGFVNQIKKKSVLGSEQLPTPVSSPDTMPLKTPQYDIVAINFDEEVA